MVLRAAVVLLVAGPPVPYRSKLMTVVKKGYSDPPCWVLQHEASNLMSVLKKSLLRSLIMAKRWQQKAVNKEEWVPVINEAKVLRGLYSKDVSKHVSK
jgi:hypothetical protein